jgi:hypothetical protein
MELKLASGIGLSQHLLIPGTVRHGDCLVVSRDRHIAQGDKQLRFGPEGCLNGPKGHARRLRNVTQGRACIAMLDKQGERRIQDCTPG